FHSAANGTSARADTPVKNAGSSERGRGAGTGSVRGSARSGAGSTAGRPRPWTSGRGRRPAGRVRPGARDRVPGLRTGQRAVHQEQAAGHASFLPAGTRGCTRPRLEVILAGEGGHRMFGPG